MGLKIETIDIDLLVPSKKNPRNHPDFAIEKIAKSLQKFGWTNPILITQNNRIIAGHARIKAAKKVGIKKVPVMRLDFDNRMADLYMVADNKLQDLTEWDQFKLTDLLQELNVDDFDIEAIGFDENEMKKLFDDLPEVTVDENYHYQLIVDCENEDHQSRLINQFEKEGLKCRPLIL